MNHLLEPENKKLIVKYIYENKDTFFKGYSNLEPLKHFRILDIYKISISLDGSNQIIYCNMSDGTGVFNSEILIRINVINIIMRRNKLNKIREKIGID